MRPWWRWITANAPNHTLALQGLFYPTVQTRMATASWQAYGDTALLDRQLMAWFDRHCANPQLREAWHREPFVAPAWIGLTECDILSSEGHAYADTLRAASEAHAALAQAVGRALGTIPAP